MIIIYIFHCLFVCFKQEAERKALAPRSQKSTETTYSAWKTSPSTSATLRPPSFAHPPRPAARVTSTPSLPAAVAATFAVAYPGQAGPCSDQGSTSCALPPSGTRPRDGSCTLWPGGRPLGGARFSTPSSVMSMCCDEPHRLCPSYYGLRGLIWGDI